MKTISNIILSIISGCLVFLSFPNYNYFFLLWIAFVPLLVAIHNSSPRASFFYGWLAGTVTNTGGFFWISGMLQEFAHLPLYPSIGLTVLLAAYQGLTFALFSYFSRFILTNYKKIPASVVYPFVFVTVEFLVPFIFPWYVGNGQFKFLPIIQIADITGVEGISFLIIFFNTALFLFLYNSIKSKKLVVQKSFLVAVFLVVSSIFYGLYRINSMKQEILKATKLKVGLVEANIGIWEKQAKNLSPKERILTLYKNLMKHQKLSQKLDKMGAELIVWPESSYVPYEAIAVKITNKFLFAGGDNITLLSFDRKNRVMIEDIDDIKQKFFKQGKGLKVVDIAGRGDNDVFFVLNKEGFIHFNGLKFTYYPYGFNEQVTAGEHCGKNCVIVATKTGNIYRFFKGVGEKLFNVGNNTVYDIEETGDYDFLLCGKNGFFARIKEGKLHILNSGTKSDLYTISFPYVAGEGGIILKLVKGKHLKRVPSGTKKSIYTSMKLNGTYVFAGENGTLLVLRNGNVKKILLPTAKDILSCAGYDGKFYFGTKKGGVLFTRNLKDFEFLDTGVNVGITSLFYLDFFDSFYFPRNVKYVYVSKLPLYDDVYKYIKCRPRDRNSVIRGFSKPVLFGAITKDFDTGKIYNSALLIDETGKVLGIYDKNYLLVFGEYIPFESVLGFLRKMIPEAGNFEPGKDVKIFKLLGHNIGVMICYEDIIPAFTRKLAGKNPELLINLTNDAWFGKTSEPYLHLALAVFRAVENRLFLIRSTNTGVSAFIDPNGKILKMSDLDNPEVLMEKVAFLKEHTFYRKFGDIFSYFIVFFTSIFTFIAFVSKSSENFRKKQKEKKKHAGKSDISKSKDKKKEKSGSKKGSKSKKLAEKSKKSEKSSGKNKKKS